jgi:cellulose synthase/poly-beta-1,6-N-acetylglucosamine synthase-like glycosyltransferase
LRLFSTRHEPSSNGETSHPSLSILLSAYNEEKHIAARIDNLLALDYPADRIEIIIASDGSTDSTNDIVHRYTDPRIHLLTITPRSGKPHALNHLVTAAHHDILVFTDANTFFAKDALQKLTRHFTNIHVGGVCGHLVFLGANAQTNEDPYWKLETFLKTRESQLDSCLGANGGIYAIRRALWPRIPDNTFIDDFVVGMKIREQGFRFLYDHDAVATEDLPVSVGHEMTRRIRIGAGGFQALGLCWRSLLPWRGWYVWSFWSHKVLRWLGPFLMLGALFANMFLLQSLFFRVAFFLQLLFYALALAAVVSRKKITIFTAPHYFVVINLALFLGFFRFITKTQRATWKRTPR